MSVPQSDNKAIVTCFICGKPADQIMLVDGEQIEGARGYDGCLDGKPTKFGDALRKRRMDLHVSLYDLAKQVKFANGPVSISAVERGFSFVTKADAVRFAIALDADPDEWAALAHRDIADFYGITFAPDTV